MDFKLVAKSRATPKTGGNMRRLLLVSSIFFGLMSLNAPAAELKGVNLADKIKVGDKELVLNGLGLRQVSRFGIRVSVYVMGVYLQKKESDPAKIVAMEGPKVFKMEFVRNVDQKSLIDAWKEGFFATCEKDCESAKSKLTEFNNLMSEMREGKGIVMTIYKDRVEVDANGRKPKKGTIQGEDFARAIQNIWMGSATKAPEMKAGLLGAK